MKIISVYKYFDDQTKYYNYFIFLEHCSIHYCIHKFDYTSNWLSSNNDLELMSQDENVYVYLYENKNIMRSSIYQLKHTFNPIKKCSITKSLPDFLKCFSCYSCNFIVHMLELAYNENPQNIIDNGIYANYTKIFFNDENEKETLSECIQYEADMIITPLHI